MILSPERMIGVPEDVVKKDKNTYVVGDIHGNADQLSALITKIEEQIRRDDIIVFLGDYIDRGPDTKDVISQLIALRRRYGKRMIFLRGNHEQWFAKTYAERTSTSWILGMEGLSTVRSYSSEAESLIIDEIRSLGIRLFQEEKIELLSYKRLFDSMPEDHIDFLVSGLKNYYEENDLICSHSGINPDRPLMEQRDEDLYWNDPGRMMASWKGPQTLVIGHKDTATIDPFMEGRPIIKEHVVLLDTGNVLTAVRFPDRKVLQSVDHQSE